MRLPSPLALVALALLTPLGIALGAFPGQAQEQPRLSVEISKPGARELPTAVTLPIGGAPEAEAFWALVQRDLEISGYFKLIPEDAFLEPPTAGLQPGQFRFEDWDPQGTVVLARTGLTQTGDTLSAEVWVYDTPARSKLGAQSFKASRSQWRALAHRTANEIIKQVTGEAGVFDTRFAAVSKASGNKEIVLVDVDGGQVVPITRNGAINLQPAWSPSGNALVFTSYKANNPDLYVADLVKGSIRRVSARSGLNIGGAWGPNNLIALTLAPGGNSDIFTLDPVTGREVSRLTTDPGIDVSPTWSPDGSAIAFASERSGGVHVYTMPAGGGSPTRVSFVGTHNTDPAWSPRGDRIAFVSRDGRFDVYTTDLSGNNTLRITEGQGDNEDPTWSPDGRYLSFASTRKGGSQIWVSTSDGRHQVQITTGGPYTNPAWSPRLSW